MLVALEARVSPRTKNAGMVWEVWKSVEWYLYTPATYAEMIWETRYHGDITSHGGFISKNRPISPATGFANQSGPTLSKNLPGNPSDDNILALPQTMVDTENLTPLSSTNATLQILPFQPRTIPATMPPRYHAGNLPTLSSSTQRVST